MQQADSSSRSLSPITIGLHWVVGLGCIAMIGVGFFMKNWEVYSLYDTHKSIGVLLLLVIIARVVWRARKGWPKPVSDYTPMEKAASKAAHWGLIIGSLLMPISGFMLSAASGHGVGVFGLRVFPSRYDAEGQAVAYSEALYSLGKLMHEFGGYLLAAVIVLHVAGALKHHFIDKDQTLTRMLGRPVKD